MKTDPELPDLEPLLAHAEKDLGIPDGFFSRMLYDPDDWSYVVKLHAFAETAITQSILATIAQPGIETPMRKLQMRTKIALAKGLGMLSPQSVKFLEAFGPLRNSVAHDVAQLAIFSLAAWSTSPPPGTSPSHLFGEYVVQLKHDALPGGSASYRLALWARTIRVLTDLRVGRFRFMDTAQSAFQAIMNVTSEPANPAPIDRADARAKGDTQ